MSLFISNPRSASATAEDPVLVDHLDELRKVNLKLRLLVCELLDKNQQLRFQRTEQETTRADPKSALAIGGLLDE
jgi:hypothetical protein